MRRLIGITPSEDVFREKERISSLIRSGIVTYFHIRKPYYNEKQMRDYLSLFDDDIKERLSLHDFQYLAQEMNIGGVHINNRCDLNSIFSQNNTKLFPQKRYSVSCHSIQEVQKWKQYTDYCFLSPILDSFSKQGYKSKFSCEELKKYFQEKILDDKVVALSGVSFDNLNSLESIGFSSFAMLSSLFELPKTMFISHENENFDYISGCKAALKGGIRFIQLRMKDFSDDKVLDMAKIIRKECDKYAALLTIDDRIHLLETNLFDGVHLGKNDMPISQAKQITQGKYLLGATCNTFEDCLKAVNDGADYLGVGPFRFTTTKKNLSTILGLQGYKNITTELHKKNINIPIYAIGGITTKDLTDLKQTDIYGIAVSGAILNNSNQTSAIINDFLATF